MDDEELEPKVLSYREFRNRETLLAWQRRRQAHESQLLSRSDRRRDPFMKLARGAAAPPAASAPR